MNTTTFKAVVRAVDGSFEWLDVAGETLGDGLVLHRSVRSIKGQPRLVDDSYTVSDIASGCKLFSNDTREEVLTDLAEYSSKLGERFLAALAEGRARCRMIYGQPPVAEMEK